MAKTTSCSGIAVLLLAVLAVQQLDAVQQAHAAVTCRDVVNDLSPCLDFLQDHEGQPSGQCCAGVRALYAAAGTKADRQATCECLKAAYNQVDAKLSAAQELPADCGLSLSYNITPDIDCSTVE